MNKSWFGLLPPMFLFSSRHREMMGFALRTWLASMLALYIAFALQLESPYWAWLTVWIVAQPVATASRRASTKTERSRPGAPRRVARP